MAAWTKHVSTSLVPLVLASVADRAVAQHDDSTERRAHVTGAVTITNKGISLLPALTLGKPAAIVDVAITDGALSFEPQFRVALGGKPWSFIFWGRYRPLRSEKFHLVLGAHPAVLFRTIPVSTNGLQRDALVATRYLAGEVYPSYSVAKNLSVGVYYLYAHGVEQEAVQHTHFVATRATLTNVRISGPYFMQFAPQLYYLRMDGRDGFYVHSGWTLANRKLPLSIAATVNQTIRTGIAAGKGFLWNVSVVYSLK